MTEKEKMLSGQLYCAVDKELSRERDYAKELCYRFNRIYPTRYNEKLRILKKLFRTDKKCWIEPPFYCDYGYNIIFGKNFYANHGCIILDANSVKMGDNVFLAPYVQICTATHPTTPDIRESGLEYALPIEIGSNIWIGAGAIILAGIKIGNNSVIGAGSIVNKDVPSNVLALGNPCRVVRELK